MARTYEQICDSLPDDERRILQSYADQRVTSGVKAYAAAHPSVDDTGLSERILRIEAAHSRAVADADLRFTIFRECSERGLNFDILSDLPFKNKEEALEKIKALSEEKKKVAEEQESRIRNELLTSSGFKPGSGNTGAGGPRVENMNADQIFQLESAGRLDGHLR